MERAKCKIYIQITYLVKWDIFWKDGHINCLAKINQLETQIPRLNKDFSSLTFLTREIYSVNVPSITYQLRGLIQPLSKPLGVILTLLDLTYSKLKTFPSPLFLIFMKIRGWEFLLVAKQITGNHVWMFLYTIRML